MSLAVASFCKSTKALPRAPLKCTGVGAEGGCQTKPSQAGGGAALSGRSAAASPAAVPSSRASCRLKEAAAAPARRTPSPLPSPAAPAAPSGITRQDFSSLHTARAPRWEARWSEGLRPPASRRVSARSRVRPRPESDPSASTRSSSTWRKSCQPEARATPAAGKIATPWRSKRAGSSPSGSRRASAIPTTSIPASIMCRAAR